MRTKIQNLIKLLIFPLAMFGVYLLILVLWKLLNLPTDQELMEISKNWFDRWGLIFVFVSAIIESALILGQYYPGGLVIFLGVVSAGKNIPLTITVVAIVCLAFFIGYSIDYFVGKLGWYRLFLKFGLKDSLAEAQKKLQKHELNAIMFSYWEPNLASITATAAGILQLPFKKFSINSIIGIVIWNAIWGTLVASLGENAFKLIGLKWVSIIVLSWIAVILLKHYLFNREQTRLNLP